MTKIHKKKANILGKKIPVLLLALIVVAGIGSAALLNYYGQITGSATVNQSVTLNGKNIDDMPLKFSFDGTTFVAGKTFLDGTYTLANNAEVPASVEFVTTQKGDGDHAGADNVDGIETKYWSLAEDSNALEPVSSGTYSTDRGDFSVNRGYSGTTIDFTINADLNSGYIHKNSILVMDEDNDGSTDYQIKLENGEVRYYSHEGGTVGAAKELSTVEGISFSGDENEFVVSIEMSRLGEEYRYEAQVTTLRESDNAASISYKYPEEDFAWFDSSDIPVTDLGTEFSGQKTLGAGESFDFVVTNEFDLRLVPKDYSVKTEIVPVTE